MCLRDWPRQALMGELHARKGTKGEGSTVMVSQLTVC